MAVNKTIMDEVMRDALSRVVRTGHGPLDNKVYSFGY